MNRDDFPIERKLGFAHAVEMAGIEAALRADGVTGIELHFAAVRTYEALHKNDASFKVRQQIWLATQTAQTKPDLLRLALEAIRDGHNNPSELALLTLENWGRTL